MRRLFVSSVLVLLSACSAAGPSSSDDAGGPPVDEDSGTVDDTGSPPLDGTPGPTCSGLASGLEASTRKYALPAPRCGSKFDAAAKSGALAYAMLDLTGDGVPDLVVHSDSCASEVGKTRWDVYAGSSGGFAASPTAWSLPAPRCKASFDALARSGTISYALLDLTGDGRSDLVVFRDGCDPSVGADHWDVYAAGASGFAAAPSRYALPAARCATKFDESGKRASLEYSLLDLGGDRRPDLVVFRDGCDPSVGRDRWDVYEGGAAGFAAAPKPFALPAARCATKFDSAAKYGAVGYALVDLGGDGRPDLVVHEDDCDRDVGAARWDVYAAGPSGFAAAPVKHALPAPRCGARFDALAKTGSVGFGLFDFSCDGKPDLVVHDDSCNDQVGASHWDLYEGAGGGFAAAPRAFALPSPRCKARFDALGSGYGSLRWSLLRIGGGKAGRPSLVVFGDACDESVGRDHWDVYDAR